MGPLRPLVLRFQCAGQYRTKHERPCRHRSLSIRLAVRSSDVSMSVPVFWRALEIFENEFEHHVTHMANQSLIADPMPRFWIGHELELLACLFKFIDELYRVLHMYCLLY